jgi:type I restriction enzyme M protein
VLTEPENRRKATANFTLGPEENFAKVFELAVKKAFKQELTELTRDVTAGKTKNKIVKGFIGSLSTAVEWTHRHYVKDDEYIPYGENIEAFLNREIAKPIIRWADNPQLGYEILPNKYFYRYQPPTPAKELLAEFWRLEKEAEEVLLRLEK